MTASHREKAQETEGDREEGRGEISHIDRDEPGAIDGVERHLWTRRQTLTAMTTAALGGVAGAGWWQSAKATTGASSGERTETGGRGMIVRRSGDRGHFDHGWLDTFHTFSFADYHDPAHMGFRGLRVINEDRIAPGRGFGTHPHRDMEIVTYVLEGALRHRDSMGNGSVIRPGEVQRMTAGTGVFHSEFNASGEEAVHLLQIWIRPARLGLTPGYEQRPFEQREQAGQFRVVASPDGRDGSVTIHADATLHAGRFGAGERGRFLLGAGHQAWIQVARGRCRLQGVELAAGDGASLSGEATLEVEGLSASEILLFDLA